MHLRVGYSYDRRLHEEANLAGRNYWYCYVEEICDRLGVSAQPFDRPDLACPAALEGYSALIVGDLEAAQVPEGAAEALGEWVEAGGLLIGFMTAGLESVFGCRPRTRIRRPGDDFCQGAAFALVDHPVTAGVHSPIRPRQRLIILGDALALDLEGAEEVARLFNLTLNTFYHPCNVARFAPCRAAIDEVLRYVAERGWRVAHMGNDELWRSWSARSRAQLSDAQATDSGVSFVAACDYSGGFTVRVPCGERTLKEARCDGAPAPRAVRLEFGQYWAEVALPPGEHRVEFDWKQP